VDVSLAALSPIPLPMDQEYNGELTEAGAIYR
jgi:hypothetical protein